MSGVPSRDRATLLDDMRSALRSEFGARAMYGFLSRRIPDRELADLLGRFEVEEAEQVDRLRHLMSDLGGRPAARSLRRRTAAWLLYLGTWVGARRIALRLCLESEETVSRWYAHFAQVLEGEGADDHARTCRDLATTKLRHALALQAWVAR
jgi:rubrerythrin